MIKFLDKQILKYCSQQVTHQYQMIYPFIKKHFPRIKEEEVKIRICLLIKKGLISSQPSVKVDINPEPKLLAKPKAKPLNNNLESGSYNGYQDFLDIAKKYKYRVTFKKRQLHEANIIADLDINKTTERHDYTQDLVVTIDGKTAKDLDDAISLSKKDDIYYLQVHIADVSHYVREESALDKEAIRRGNSVYLLDHVIPMFPKVISNGICSLNQGENRFVLSMEAHLDKNANVLNYQIKKGIIRVERRMTYDEVESIVDGSYGQANHQSADDAQPEYSDKLIQMIVLMKELTLKLYQQRIQNGSIDFKLDDIYLDTNKHFFPISVGRKRRLFSCQLIEEFMLLANRLVASWLSEKKGSVIYRVHESPDVKDVQKLNQMFLPLGYRLDYEDGLNNSKISSKPFQSLLRYTKEREEEKHINRMMLRAMKQADYRLNNQGHFALAFSHYVHFTSPIRRYADLLIHRMIKENLGTKLYLSRIKKRKVFLAKTAKHISNTERVAMDAERDMVKRKIALFMHDKVNQSFDGMIVSIASMGMFIELSQYGIEGLLSLSNLNQRVVYDDNQRCLCHHDGSIAYKVGMKLQVIVSSVCLKQNFVNFILDN